MVLASEDQGRSKNLRRPRSTDMDEKSTDAREEGYESEDDYPEEPSEAGSHQWSESPRRPYSEPAPATRQDSSDAEDDNHGVS